MKAAKAFLLILVAATLLGALAYLTDSILPGVVLHALGDAVSGVAWWWQSSQAAPVSSQRDWLLPLAVVATVLCAPAAVWAYRRLAVVARNDKLQSVSPPSAGATAA